LLAAQEVALELATRRQQLASANEAQVRRRFSVGIVGPEAVAAAVAELESMRTNLDRIRLNIEEIRATSKPQRDDLAAPLVNGRDFVKERLEVELMKAQRDLTVVESALEEAARRNRVTGSNPVQLLEVQAELVRARGYLEILVGKLRLRQSFFSDRLSAEDLARSVQRLEATQEIAIAERTLAAAQARLAQVREMRRVGTVDQVELLRAELAVAEGAARMEELRRSLNVP
jgi:hypothetical protein